MGEHGPAEVVDDRVESFIEVEVGVVCVGVLAEAGKESK